MVICPIALAVGCKRCPIFAICPVKGIIGDHKKGDSTAAKTRGGKADVGPRRK